MEGFRVEGVVTREQDGSLLGDFTRVRMGQDTIRLLDRDEPAFMRGYDAYATSERDPISSQSHQW
jgi:hypothetical protein